MNPYKYKSKKFLTPHEQELFHLLTDLLDDVYIFPQIHLGSIASPRVRRHPKAGWKFWNFARIRADRRSIDFLICSKELKPIFAIELDGNEHNSTVHAKTDQELNRILDEADIPLMRIANSEISNSEALLERLKPMFRYTSES